MGLSTLSAYAAPHLTADNTVPVVCAIDARHEHVYLQVFSPDGRTLTPPRLATLREAAQAASSSPTCIVRSAAHAVAAAMRENQRGTRSHRCTGGAGHRLGRAPRRHWRTDRRRGRNICTRRARSRNTPPNFRADDQFRHPPAEPVQNPPSPRTETATPRSPPCTRLRFSAAWARTATHRLIIDRNIITHRVTVSRNISGFILSRLAADEAEILSMVARRLGADAASLGRCSISICADWPGWHHWRSLGRRAECTGRRLYDGAGLHEVARREGYYEGSATALVLRRDLG